MKNEEIVKDVPPKFTKLLLCTFLLPEKRAPCCVACKNLHTLDFDPENEKLGTMNETVVLCFLCFSKHKHAA